MGKIISYSQSSFNAGEISPRMQGRTDHEKYKSGLDTCENAVVLPHGGVVRRTGLQFIRETYDSTKLTELIPFEFSEDQAYVLEFGDTTMRVFMDGGIVVTPDSYTKLLLHCDGDDGDITFDDDSQSDHTVTVASSAQVDTAQYKFATGSLLLDGTGDYLSVPDHGDWNFGANEFTIDLWARFDGLTRINTLYYQNDTTTGDIVWFFFDGPRDTLCFRVVDTGALVVEVTATPTTIADATWHHIAVVNDTTDIKIYVDGAEVGTKSSAGITMPNHDQSVKIGGGTAANLFLDFCATPKVTTLNGGALVTTAEDGFYLSTLYCDGANDYVSIPDHADFDLFAEATSCIDLWVKFVAHAGTSCLIEHHTDANNFWAIRNIHGSYLAFQIYDGLYRVDTRGPEIANESWHHIVVVNKADHFGLFVDGIQQGYYYYTTNKSFAGNLDIGSFNGAGEWTNAYYDEIRLMHADPYSVDPGVWLLDSSGAAHGYATAEGYVYPSYTGKWGSGGFYLDGSNDSITFADHADWDVVAEATSTIDFWAKLSDHTGSDSYISQLQDGNNYWDFANVHGTGLQFVMATGGVVRWTASGTEISDTDWHHFAFVNSGDKFGVYVDGVQNSYAADTNNYAVNGPIDIGSQGGAARFLQGYIDEVRITHSNVFNTDPGLWLFDSSNSAHGYAAVVNTPTMDQTTKKWGTAALDLDTGGSDCITFADHADWDCCNQTNFTIDAWVKMDDINSEDVLVSHFQDANNRWWVEHDNTAGLRTFIYSGGGETVRCSGGIIPDTDWHHVAWVKVGNYWANYIDGVQTAYLYDTSTVTLAGTLYIGQTGAGSAYWPGKVDELRMTHANSFSVTPNAWVLDSSAEAHGYATGYGYVAPSSQTKFGTGSAGFNGSSQYIEWAADTDYSITDKDNATVDFWARFGSHGAVDRLVQCYEDVNNGWSLRHSHGTGFELYMRNGGATWNTPAGGEITDSNWHHIAICHVLNEWGIYVDGQQVIYYATATEDAHNGALRFGAGQDGGGGWDYFEGQISEARITHTNAFSATPVVANTDTITVPVGQHTTTDAKFLAHMSYSALTVPTAAHTSNADTKLLMHFDSSTITVPTGAHTSDADTVLLLHGNPDSVVDQTSPVSPDADTVLLLKPDQYHMKGWMDEYRVSKGSARWAAAFTPATSEYPAGGGSSIYSLTTPYADEDVELLRVVQSTDTLYIAHPEYNVYKLQRTDHDLWTITEIDWAEPPWCDMNDTATTLDSGNTTGSGIALVASASLFSADMVGVYIKMKNGFGRIATVTDATNATWDIKDDLDDHVATADWYRSVWGDDYGWPSCITFHEDRLICAGSDEYPLSIFMSKVGDYEDFSVSSPVVSDDGLSISIWSQQQNKVKWLASGKRLFVGTVGSEFWISGSDIDTPISPTSIQAKPETRVGSEGIAPVQVDNAVVFVQDGGERLRLWSYTLTSDGFESVDLSLIAEHLTSGNPIYKMQFAQWPHSVIWCTTYDGTLLGLTLIKESKVVAWHKHTTGTTDTVESIAVIPGDDGDELWAVVARSVGGSTKRYIERLAKDFYGGDIDDAFFVDSGLTYNETVPATIFTGMDHLEGETVQVLADGVYVGTETIAAGGFTLAAAASDVHAGLAYNTNIQTLPWNLAGEGEGTTDMYKKRIVSILLKLNETSELQFGRNSSTLLDLLMTDGVLNSDWEFIEFNGDYDRDVSIYLRQNKPLPVTVLAIAADIDVGGK